MKKTTERLLAAVLCLVMVLGALPLTALAGNYSAADPKESTYEVGDYYAVRREAFSDTFGQLPDAPEGTKWVYANEGYCSDPEHGSSGSFAHDCNDWDECGFQLGAWATYRRYKLVADTTGGGETSKVPGEITANKKLGNNGAQDEDGYYTIELTIQGNQINHTVETGYDVVLVMDYSGSMGGKGGYPSCIGAARTAAKAFSNQILGNNTSKADGKQNRMALIKFNSDASVVAEQGAEQFTSSESTMNSRIDELHKPDGGTNYDNALSKALNVLNGRSDSDKTNRPGVVVFITDGNPDPNNANGKTYADQIKQQKYTLYTIGIGLGRDQDAKSLLTRLATTATADKKYAYFVSNDTSKVENELKGVLTEIAYRTELMAAGTNAVMTDIINSDYFELVEGSLEGNGLAVDEETGDLVWTIGDIPTTTKTVSFKIKVKEGRTVDLSADGEPKKTNNDVHLDYINPDGKDAQIPESEIGEPKVTLYGTQKYTLTYDGNGGKFGTGEDATDTREDATKYASGATADLDFTNTPAHDAVDNKNVVFIGWSKTQYGVLSKTDSKPDLINKVTFGEGNETVYAVWGYDYEGGADATPDVYQAIVTYKIDGGYWNAEGTDDSDKTYKNDLYTLATEGDDAGTWVGITPAPTLAWIQSTGSVTAKAGHKTAGAAWKNSTPSTKSLLKDVDGTTYTYTLPALGSYTVSYVKNAGSDTVSNMPTNQTKTEGVDLKLSEQKPTRANHTFTGWKDSSGTAYESGATYSTDADLTLYAQWQENEKYTYTLKYDANGGTSAPADDVYPTGDETTYDESHAFDVSSTEPTRANYTFLGWADSASASTAKYTSDGFGNTATTVTVSNTDTNCTKTIYAVWQENDNYAFTLTYDANAGTDTVTNMPDPSTVSSGKVYTTSYEFTVSTVTPSRDGYTFKGWATTQNAYTADVGATVTVSTADTNNNKTIYAVWRQKQANLTVTKTVYSIKRSDTYIYGGDSGATSIPYVQTDDVIVWQITVTNSGNAAGTASLTDTLTKAADETVSLTAFYTDAACTETATDFEIPANRDDVNGSKTYYVKYTVLSTDTGTLTNSVKVNDDDELVPAPDVPVGEPSLSVTKKVYSVGGVKDQTQSPTGYSGYASTSKIPTAKVDDVIIWRVDVTNSGTAAGKFNLTDSLIGENCKFYSDESCTTEVTDWPQTISAAYGNTPHGESYYVEYTVTKDDIGTTLVNKVTLREDGESDKDGTAPGVPVGGLTVEKTVNVPEIKFEPSLDEVAPNNQRAAAETPAYTAKVGDTITWTITVTNYFDTAQTFTLVDTLSNSANVTLNPAPTDGKYTIDAAAIEGSVITPAVKEITATYVVVESDEGTTLVNTAIMKQGDKEIDDDTAPGVEVEGKLSVAKKVYSITRGNDEIYNLEKDANNSVPKAKIGDKITWEIKVTNTGNKTIYYTLSDVLKGRTDSLTIYNQRRTETIAASAVQTLEPRQTDENVPTCNVYYVEYTVKPSDYNATLINVVTVTETDAEGKPKTDPKEVPSNPVDVEDKPNTPSYNPNYNAGVQLEKGEHFNYVIGYSDGTVRPEGNITRAEVATIFFRLLTDESRKTYLTEYNTFTDVEKSMWHNVAISTLARAGVLNGYNDGSFRPDNNITRAEMAAIISRFAELEGSTRISFTDIKGHWAEKSILLAASNGWINGYNDGSFRPDQNITRAETFAMINRVLERKVEHVNDLVSDMNTWVDNMDTTQWYYFDVQEATNYHSYQRKYTNTNAEKWIRKLTDIDWTVYQY